MSVVRFVPSNADTLDLIYKALNECQVLHPDPNDECLDEGKCDILLQF